MAKANNKTTRKDDSVEAFLNSVAEEQQRADSHKIDAIMQRVTGEKPKMWAALLSVMALGI